MGDQQGTLSTEDLGWLGGIIDGEGCISLSRLRKTRTCTIYKPYLVISNTDPWLIEEMHRLLVLLDVGHYIQWRKPYGNRHSKKMMGAIVIMGLKRCQKALGVLSPHIRGKKKEAERLAEWIERRLAIHPGKHNTYSEVDDWFYNELHDLKDKGASETTRGARRWASDPDDGKI